jgi:hypothetical protein
MSVVSGARLRIERRAAVWRTAIYSSTLGDTDMRLIKLTAIARGNTILTPRLSATLDAAGGTVGSGVVNALTLVDDHHSILERQMAIRYDGGWQAVNLGEGVAVAVNGMPLAVGDHASLKTGDVIDIGPYVLCASDGGAPRDWNASQSEERSANADELQLAPGASSLRIRKVDEELSSQRTTSESELLNLLDLPTDPLALFNESDGLQGRLLATEEEPAFDALAPDLPAPRPAGDGAVAGGHRPWRADLHCDDAADAVAQYENRFRVRTAVPDEQALATEQKSVDESRMMAGRVSVDNAGRALFDLSPADGRAVLSPAAVLGASTDGTGAIGAGRYVQPEATATRSDSGWHELVQAFAAGFGAAEPSVAAPPGLTPEFMRMLGAMLRYIKYPDARK